MGHASPASVDSLFRESQRRPGSVRPRGPATGVGNPVDSVVVADFKAGFRQHALAEGARRAVQLGAVPFVVEHVRELVRGIRARAMDVLRLHPDGAIFEVGRSRVCRRWPCVCGTGLPGPSSGPRARALSPSVAVCLLCWMGEAAHLKECIKSSHLAALLRFRVCAQDLQVSRARARLRAERVCRMCMAGAVEDEGTSCWTASCVWGRWHADGGSGNATVRCMDSCLPFHGQFPGSMDSPFPRVPYRLFLLLGTYGLAVGLYLSVCLFVTSNEIVSFRSGTLGIVPARCTCQL